MSGRIEDDRLLRGAGTFAADVRATATLELVIVRSARAHARVTVDASRARAMPGVVAVLTADDLTDVAPLPDFADWVHPVRAFPLARGVVRYVGAPVAAVVAESRYVGEDAAEQVEITYDELPVVASVDAALADDAPRLFEDWPDNRLVDARPTDAAVELTRQELARAEVVVGGRFAVGRQAAVPMEPRACFAEVRDDVLTLSMSTQVPHMVRTVLARVLPVREARIRVIAADVGGSFGAKSHTYPEEILACWFALRQRRPVRFVEDRAEHFVATSHARDTTVELEAAADADGRVLALRGEIVQDVGSGEIFPGGFNPAFNAWGSLTGPYRIRAQAVGVTCAVTNKTPSGAYRGFGMPEASFAMERLLDRLAARLGLAPAEIRRRNLLRPDDIPFVTPTGLVLDAGSHREAFERAIELGDRIARAARGEHGRAGSRRVGVGCSAYIEGTGGSDFGTTGFWADQDTVRLRFDPDGSLTVGSGVSTTGQGVPTMLATLAAQTLRVPRDAIHVVIGDTARAPHGLGGWGSRSTGVAGGALLRAAAEVCAKGRRIAAHLLTVAPEEVELGDDGFVHADSTRRVDWATVASTALVRVVDLPPGEEPGLEARATWRAPGIDQEPGPDGLMNACPTYANGSQAAVVEVDVETGRVRVLALVDVHDCGRVINPQIVEGLVHGGAAQGIAGALLEELRYTPQGQPLATTLATYAIPTANEVPPITVGHIETPSATMPFGAKGAGEAGVIGSAAAIAQAIEDALPELAAGSLATTPLGPAVIQRALAQVRVDAQPIAR